MAVYILDSKRTALGSFGKTLANVSAADLGATVVADLVRVNNINVKDIDEVVTGNVLPAAAGQGLGRQVVIKAGLDQMTPGYTVNMVCGSGVKSMVDAFNAIEAGQAKCIIAGGTENMSLSPYALTNARFGMRLNNTTTIDTLVNDALTDAFNGIHMGITAENIANEYHISREEQDQFAYESQQKAGAAIEAGYFKDQIVPVTIKNRKGDIIFDTDEDVKASTPLEKLASLRPVFKEGGSVTAGNASGINDGAAYSVLVSEEMLSKYDHAPLAKIIAYGQAGLDPLVMGLGPVYAIENLMKKVDIKFEDIDLFELNEAFAAQSLGVVIGLSEKFSVSEKYIKERTNITGGAIALGHPVGASGARVVTTLLYNLKRLNKRYGIASLCIGGGMGIAILVENYDFIKA